MSAPASRTGAAGASGSVSELGDQPPQRCPETRIRPPRRRRPASQPRLHPASQRGAAPALHRRLLPAPPQPPDPSKPLVFVLSLRRPQGAGRVTPRGGILSRSLRRAEKRVPAPTLSPQPLLGPSVPLGLAKPGSRVGRGIWIPASFQNGTGMEQRRASPSKSGRRPLLDASHLLKVPDLFVFAILKSPPKVAGSLIGHGWGKPDCRGLDLISNQDWLADWLLRLLIGSH